MLVALVSSDLTLLLLARHDFGPIAVSFLLRVLFLGLAIRQVASPVRGRKPFALGLIAGLSIYEKLSNVALLPSVLLIVAIDRCRQARSRVLSGLLLGILPLLAANLTYYWRLGEVLSLRHVERFGVGEGMRPLLETLALGQGGRVAEEILGLARSPRLEAAEGVLVILLLAAVILFGGKAQAGRGVETEAARRAQLCVFFSATGVVMTWCLPRTSAPWHWIIVTPSLGAAIAFLFESTRRRAPRAASLVGLAVGALIALRAIHAVDVHRALLEGRAAAHWSSGIDEFSRRAVEAGESELFVATDWGVAAQLYCFASGRRHHVIETTFRADGARHAELMASRWGKDVVHLVRPRELGPIDPSPAIAIERAFAASTEWQEEKPRADWVSLDAVRVRTFRRAAFPQ